MNAARLSRLSHKWIGLLVGLQLVAWAISGFYMVVVDLDFIHGDSLVRDSSAVVDLSDAQVSWHSLREQRTGITRISLRSMADDGAPVFEIVTTDGRSLVDARTGDTISPLSEARIRNLARTYYAGKGDVARTTLISSEGDKPLELQSRPVPIWRVDFDDWLETSFYIDPDTGDLTTRRHRFWRWFDFLWSLHIMDYRERTDVNNWLLRGFTALGVVLTGSGLWLCFHSFGFLQGNRHRRGRR